MLRSWTKNLGIAALLLAPAVAEACPDDAERRIAFIDQSLAAGVGRARLHTYGWGSVQATAFAAHSVFFFAGAEESRPDRAASAITGLVGLGSTIVNYPLLLRDQPRVAGLAGGSGDPCARLAEMEKILVADARFEEKTRGWFRHALSLGFNLAVGLVLGLGYDRWQSAAIGSGASALVGELILFTRPTTAMDALESYRRW